ncbi:carboxyl-terminal processing protease [Marinospirillum celere]|uniref:Carboxyl-terminal processing protease n=1 Tax=Marinospirillum celere TaxID=1122252 RepID=A0A1I1GRS9_9GAMM|nr:carboxy terminal-processing peptidase [Marinospirillum celere]SFC11943.1 carboxyl-terminal processing protease [Marinospirillum celere]
MQTVLLRWVFISLLTLTLGLGLSLQAKAENSSREYTPLTELEPSSSQRQVAKEITRLLTYQHFADITLGSELEKQTLENYLKQLDPSKALLVRSEAEALLKRTDELEAALLEGKLEFAYEIYVEITGRHQERLEQNLMLLREQLDQFDFESDQRFQADRRELEWPETQEEIDTYWQQRLTHELLSLMDAEQSIEEARDLLVRRYENRLNRLRQTNSNDVFQSFMNAFTTTIDPHTGYMTPRSSDSFNIQMKLSLEGIGAMLQTDNEYTKVVSLVPGGPADRQGELAPTDRIIGVGQDEDGEIENVIGLRLDEVVDKIRGPKGSIVRLEVLAADNTDRRIIEIERNAVQLEDQAASKRILETQVDGETKRIGVIEIPTFYLDFEGQRTSRSDYRSTTRDVRRLIDELKEEGIDGLVIDLRNNGGGALQEANSLVGLFIPRGPVVQVKDADGNVQILGDNDGRVHYDGPLSVVINRLSASASEIFAGAIQDYGRGVVVGQQSFGKGTVQTILDLSEGQLKITRAKFYRISGGSTQHKGVIPDISFPPLFDPERIGESASENALPWDQVSPVIPPRESPIKARLDDLKALHQIRIQEDPNFQFLIAQSEWMQRHNGSPSISLNREQRHLEKEKEEAEQLAMENRRREGLGLEQLSSLKDEEPENPHDREPTPIDQAMLEEAGRILMDFARLNH